jgi:hypothetical protein
LAPVPVPDISEIDEERYNRMYPSIYGPLDNGPESKPFIRTHGLVKKLKLIC